ncbi:hypothetical protein F4810DRAFT_470010 [Camillea tinctor]|nr:hypothetical protein F4810DRAFT_470010 [Camillea tinctor]
MAIERSLSLLKKLNQTQSFDRDGLWIKFVRPIPSDFSFVFWGNRLAKLHDVIKQPPANACVSWFERHTSERDALTVAIIDLLLASLSGFLILILSVFQLVVAWMAWKYPTPPTPLLPLRHIFPITKNAPTILIPYIENRFRYFEH